MDDESIITQKIRLKTNHNAHTIKAKLCIFWALKSPDMINLFLKTLAAIHNA